MNEDSRSVAARIRTPYAETAPVPSIIRAGLFSISAIYPLSALEIPVVGVGGVTAVLSIACLTHAVVSGGALPRRLLVSALSITYLLALAAVGSSATGPASTESLMNYGSLAYALLPLVVVAIVIKSDTRAVGSALSGYAIGCLILSASIWLSPNQINGRAIGFAQHPVEVGGTLAVGIVLWLYLPVRRRVLRVVGMAAAGLCLSGIFRADALTGILAVAVGVLVGALLARRISAVLGTLAAVSLAWLLFGAQLAVEGLWEKLVIQLGALPADFSNVAYNSANTLASRLATMLIGSERAMTSPVLGLGLSEEATVVLGNLQPHNVLVYAWLSGGLALLAIYGCFLFAFVRNGLLAICNAPDRLGDVVVPVVAASSAAWVAAMTGPQLFERAWLLPILLAAWLGLSSGATKTRPPDAVV